MNSEPITPKLVLSDDQLRIERTHFNILVEHCIFLIKFKENIHKGIQNFIYITLILGGIFTWCSSSDTSNIYLFLEKFIRKESVPILFSIIIMVLLLIPLIAICFSAKNIRKKLFAESLLFYQTQNKLFKEFIVKILERNENKPLGGFDDIYNLIKN